MFAVLVAAEWICVPARGEVGDPQIRTDHPWYPGELAISTFPRLFETQAKVYQRVTGLPVDNDEHRALASWFWRNTHYWHGEAGRRDLWGEGLQEGHDDRLREYWNGLFAYGFGLCGTTHSQWTAEFEQLLGHARSRGVGAAGHNAFEVFLRDGPYGKGQWALLDHDLSTVIFNDTGERILGLAEVQRDVDRWADRNYKPGKQRNWLVCGLHPSDGNSYRRYDVAEYLPGYSGPPPMVHLRRGESMRRYFEPGLDDGKTFVFWGRNYNTSGIPGPERSRTWVNQPERMYGSKTGTPHRDGQVRYANVRYVYRPNFANGDYREGVVDETDEYVVFEFQTPYVIAATPPNDSSWGIYDPGCRNGLVLAGDWDGQVSISVDAGQKWDRKSFRNGLDLTDHVKGRAQYLLKFHARAADLKDIGLEMRTVCQANVAVLPRLKDNGTVVHYEAGGQRVVSMGPESRVASRYISEGSFGGTSVTFTVTGRRKIERIYAAAHVASGSPPDPNVEYLMEYRPLGEATWQLLTPPSKIRRRGDEPSDFWSQSFSYGSCNVSVPAGQPIQVRFRNTGGRRYLRGEVHLLESVPTSDPVRVTYHWTDHSGEHTQSHTFTDKGQWSLKTGQQVQTHWVEFKSP